MAMHEHESVVHPHTHAHVVPLPATGDHLGAPGGDPRSRAQPPSRSELPLSWRSSSLVVVGWREGGRGASPTVVATVPIDGGRVAVGGARTHVLAAEERIPSNVTCPTRSFSGGTKGSLVGSVAGRYLISWSAVTAADIVERESRSKRERWLRRAIDLRALCVTLEGGRGVPRSDSWEELAQAAKACRVPVPGAPDDVDVALTAAQLFLVLATRLSARGEGDLRSLLRAGRFAGPR